MLQKLAAIKEWAAALARAPFVYAMAATYAVAQENANIRGALSTNQDALTALQDSTFTADGVESAAQASTNALLFGLGFWKLYKISSEGEQARDSAVGPIIMICVGGMMTIAAIVTGIFPNLFVGTAAA
jgi:hypothetical protein